MAFESKLKPMTGLMSTTLVDPEEVTIIDRKDSWKLKVHWEIDGLAVMLVSDPAQWEIKLLLESIGEGYEGVVATQTTPAGVFGPVIHRSYNVDVTVPAANTFPPAADPADDFKAGAYKLTTVITIANGGTPLPIALYEEGEILHFYDTAP